MTLRTTMGQLLINDALPKPLRDYSGNIVLDKKGAETLLQRLAEEHSPDEYRETLKKLTDLGRDAAFPTGGGSFGLRSLLPPPGSVAIRNLIRAKLKAIYADPNIPQQERDRRIVALMQAEREGLVNTVYDEGVADNDPLTRQLIGAGRGNKSNLNTLRGADLLYDDNRGEPIPVPVLRNYAEGLRPVEYVAGAFGARKGLIDLKSATQDAGFFCICGETHVKRNSGRTTRLRDLQPGDFVRAWDWEFARETDSVVTKLFIQGRKVVNRYRFRLSDDTSATVAATADHKIYARIKGGPPEMVRLGDLGLEDTAVLSGPKGPVDCEFRGYKRIGYVETYDIEVGHRDHSYVLANGLIVSNSKQLTQATHRLMVSALDDDGPYDEANPRGLPVDSADSENVGSLLAHPVAGYARNTVLTPRVLKDIRSQGHDQILVRSPMVGGPEDGGVYGRDVGRRERGVISPTGDWVGIGAANAIAEPVTQSQISSKHTGGVAGAGKAQAGFAAINKTVQVPEVYGGALHAQHDGLVGEIVDAPQGGKFVTVNGKRHYVRPELALKVKTGDEVEAGDALTDGNMNPAEIVSHKGIGEGRRYFTNIFKSALKDAGASGSRRNIELLARGLINHVKLTDELDEWSPDDIVPYQLLERRWQPRPGAVDGDPTKLVGQYLERPTLHYSIGTKIRPSVVRELQKYGVKQVSAHREPPPFQPEMVRGMESVSKDQDWMTRMLGSYQQKGLLRGVQSGDSSDMTGSSYVGALAGGETFGRVGLSKGWDPNALKPPEPPAPPSLAPPKPLGATPPKGGFMAF